MLDVFYVLMGWRAKWISGFRSSSGLLTAPFCLFKGLPRTVSRLTVRARGRLVLRLCSCCPAFRFDLCHITDQGGPHLACLPSANPPIPIEMSRCRPGQPPFRMSWDCRQSRVGLGWSLVQGGPTLEDRSLSFWIQASLSRSRSMPPCDVCV